MGTLVGTEGPPWLVLNWKLIKCIYTEISLSTIYLLIITQVQPKSGRSAEDDPTFYLYNFTVTYLHEGQPSIDGCACDNDEEAAVSHLLDGSRGGGGSALIDVARREGDLVGSTGLTG